MEEICSGDNVLKAAHRVEANRGAPGVDGMRWHELGVYLRKHWPEIREQLLSGAYKPQPVRRVEIPKPDGGVRKLGIPTMVDRFVQQAALQVLQPRWDRRLRCLAWRMWKRGPKRYRELRRRGVNADLAATAAGSRLGPWRLSRSPALSIALPNAYFDRYDRLQLAPWKST